MKIKINYEQQLKDIKNTWLCNKFISHRGLWGDGIIENTLPAFVNAIQNGFAIETDICAIKDGSLIVFHDDNLLRLCGIDKKVCEIENIEELKSYTILNKEKIPTFDELLETVDGKTELLIEIKNYTFNGNVEKSIYERLTRYNGDYAIESFNFYSVLWFKKHAPQVYRGQLSSYFINTKGIEKIIKKGVQKLTFNKFSKPHFVAYDKKYFPNKYIQKEQSKGKSLILWTIENQEEFSNVKKNIDNIIFEGFFPVTKE